jgi:predicted nuclease of predicted toxin-antitoxin system
MKFLLDVGISPQLGRLLETQGHSFRYVPDYYSNQLTDSQILVIAKQHSEVVIAHDLDFGMQLSFSGADSPSVIIFRIHHVSAAIFFSLLMNCWETVKEPLESGALIVIDETSVRIRLLPIR